MNSGKGMDPYALMRKLVEKEISTHLLLEFYEEVADNERVFCAMVEDISTPEETEERERSVNHIECFCSILRDLQSQYEALLAFEDKFYLTESDKRENMIHNASRFLDLLETDCTIQFPSDPS